MNLKSLYLLLFSSCAQFAPLFGQAVFVDWNQNWSYLHPTTGVLPAGSGPTTPHPVDTTPWFAGQVEFDASYSGPEFASSGAGPLGYGAVNYVGSPNPAPAEFSAIATVLGTPPSGSRWTGYFRTTFEVPNSGDNHINPVIRYILDDGGFIYLDGELILRVNVSAGARDDYRVATAGTAETESQIRTADLSLPVGSTTGAAGAIAGNATVVKSLDRLSPGTHTLAVSVHNGNATSSDLVLAMQMQSEIADCSIMVSGTPTTRDFKGTPNDPADDTIGLEVTVTSSGEVSENWVITGPEGSAVTGQSGSYGVPVAITEIPIAEFAAGPLVLSFSDSLDTECWFSLSVFPQRIIATNAIIGPDAPMVTDGDSGGPGWVFDDASRTLMMNNPGGDGTRVGVTSEVIDLTGQPDVQFSGTLQVEDSSSGTEENDEFVAYLVYDGDFGSRVNLISRHDVITPDGALSGNELAPASGTFDFNLDHLVPASVNSVQIVIIGVNDAPSEVFTVRDLAFASAPPQLQATAGATVLENQGTVTPDDDVFSVPVSITPVNLGAGTGWTSNAIPASGLYSDEGPVDFGPFLSSTAPRTVTVADSLNAAMSADLVLSPETPQILIEGPNNVMRQANGPGFDDDSLTFDLEISGRNGGPSWSSNSDKFSPTEGDFGVVSFTIPAPLTPGPFEVEISDVSYPGSATTVTVDIPAIIIMGQSDLSGTLEDINNDLTLVAAPQWVNDVEERTLTLSSAGEEPRVIASEPLDLVGSGQVYFRALLRVLETDTNSNFEAEDRFKAELHYTLPRDEGGPLLLKQVLLDLEGDDFNSDGEGVSAMLNNTFPMSFDIHPAATSAVVVLSGEGLDDTESFVVSGVLFSTIKIDDPDGDGMDSTYETANGLDPNDDFDRDLDLDGDGQSNISEFLAGTAANDPNSLLRMTSFFFGEVFAGLTWSSVPGKTYQVEYSTDMLNWAPFGDEVPAADAPAAETSSGNLPLSSIGVQERVFLRAKVVN